MPPIDLKRIRAETPGCTEVLHFNNAGASLPPKAVYRSVTEHLKLESRIGGYEAEAQAHETLSRFYQAFARLLNRTIHSTPAAPDVDLLIRTSGEQRLSDFLLWESAYAELVFTDRLWPDFGAHDLAAAISEYRHRDRRFGRVAVR